MKSKINKWLGIPVIFILCVYPLHRFLCLNKPIESEILVVEGWIHHDYFDLVVEEFYKGNYQQIITTGAFISKYELDTCFSSYPQRAAQLLIKHGIAEDKIVQLPWKEFHETKTYSSFLPLKDWLQSQEPGIRSLNLYTASVHARKSYLLCKRALGDDFQIGIIAGPTLLYNPGLWIFSRLGIWLVFKNTGSLIVNIVQR